MKRNFVPEDKEYTAWLRTQPCAICGHVPTGCYPGGNQRVNAVHHVYNRDDNYSVVPLCDEYTDPSSPNCHKAKVHKNRREYTLLLESCIGYYHLRYERGHNDKRP